MLARVAAALLLAAGCGQSGDSRDKPAASDSAGAAVGTSRPPAPPTAGDAAPVSDDETFVAVAEGVADKTARRLDARGAARLAEDERPVRYAVLEPEETVDGRGAYVIEESPGKLWLVSYYADGRTMPGLVDDGRAIEHAQGHHRGGETIRFAFRGGAPVVLYHEYVEDASEGEPRITEYAKDGVCATPCPPLRGFAAEDADLQVIGPAATVDALVAKPE